MQTLKLWTPMKLEDAHACDLSLKLSHKIVMLPVSNVRNISKETVLTYNKTKFQRQFDEAETGSF